MNPLIVLFFLSLAIEDFIFRSGSLIKYYMLSIIGYSIFNIFSPKSDYHSPSRKLLLASYSHSYDPSVYVKLKPEVTKAKEYLDKLSAKIGKKITWNLFATKVMSLCAKKFPEINYAIRFGKLSDRKSTDISMLVNVKEGRDLGVVCLRRIPEKSFSKLYDEMYPEILNLKEEKSVSQNKNNNMIKMIPTFLIGLLLDIVGFLSNIGLNIKALGVESNKFGSAMVTSVGSLGLRKIYAPLCPFTHTSMVVAICSLYKKQSLNKDGSYTEKLYLPLHFTCDHRYIDGVLGAKLVKELTRLFENPNEVENIIE